MSFEEFDRKIRDAADHHHPAYDAQAWSRMEKMLDEYLPVKKDRRRRIIFFLLLFLLASGGGAGLLISRARRHARIDLQPLAATHLSPAADQRMAGNSGKSGLLGPSNSMLTQTDAPAGALLHFSRQRTNVDNNTQEINQLTQRSNVPAGGRSDDREVAGTDGDNAVGDVQSQSPLVGKNVLAPLTETAAQKNVPSGSSAALMAGADTAGSKKAATAASKKSAEGRKKDYGWAMSITAGPDISAVAGNYGSVRMVKGFGVSYNASHLFFRTGFYAVQKVYSARPVDYHFATTMPSANLERINADCQVYEVPISIGWRLNGAGRSGFFGAAGLSSYFMKKEDYQFCYTYPSGTSYTHDYYVNNRNHHFFSELTLSAGYMHRAGSRFTVSAEPYIQLPLAGVGEGKIRLKSAGLLISVGMDLHRQRR